MRLLTLLCAHCKGGSVAAWRQWVWCSFTPPVQCPPHTHHQHTHHTRIRPPTHPPLITSTHPPAPTRPAPAAKMLQDLSFSSSCASVDVSNSSALNPQACDGIQPGDYCSDACKALMTALSRPCFVSIFTDPYPETDVARL